MAIIIDNKVERPEDVVMIDDGKGHSVTIPTVMVGKEDGLKMLEYINQNPIIMVSFELKESARSNVTLWIDILDHKNYIFLRTFQSYFKRIADNSNTLIIQSISISHTPPHGAQPIATIIIVSTMENTVGMQWATTSSKTQESR